MELGNLETKIELCDGCFDPVEEFKKWTNGGNFYKAKVDRRKQFWEFANSNLKRECVQLMFDDYPTGMCRECCEELANWWNLR